MGLVDHKPFARHFSCSWQGCRKSFKRKDNLHRHYKFHNDERSYACDSPGCGQSFVERNALTVHLRIHTGEEPHECQHPGCGKRFSDSSTLARHRRLHTVKRPYKCGYEGCLRTFTQRVPMINHQRRFHQSVRQGTDMRDGYISTFDVGDGPPPTPTHWPLPPGDYQAGHNINAVTDFQILCSAVRDSSVSSDSGYSSQTAIEQRTSGQEKPPDLELFSTWGAPPDNTVCSMEASPYAHGTHRDLHTGNRSCSPMDRKVLAMKALNTTRGHSTPNHNEPDHQLDYPPTNGEPYVCLWPGCDKVFHRAGDLERHVKIHAVVFCHYPSCKRFFFDKKSLHEHGSTHNNSQYHCAFGGCHENFAHQQELISHMLRHPVLTVRPMPGITSQPERIQNSLRAF